MSKPEDFSNYPRILKIDDDGKIIALDKNGKINTDLNTNTIDDEKQRLVFGKVIYQQYYNIHDRERGLEQKQALDKSHKKTKWLIASIIVIILVAAIIIITLFINSNKDEIDNQQQTQDSNQNEQSQQQKDSNIESQNEQIQSQI